ncbi:hypothetical protein V3390_09375 [Luteimonas sp. FXH3W]|uniref:YfdX protein n=1 Tax=Aquilutibacter rugosus TaxID=3115820 RepID=A0ABU7V0Y0_9GAMM
MTQLNPEQAQQAALAVANNMYSLVEDMAIDSPEMFDIAGQQLREISTKKKHVEETRKAITGPMDQAKKKVMELFAVPISRLDEAEQILRRSLLAYKQEQDRLAAIAQREAEEKARVERERLEAERRAAEEAKRAALASNDVAAIEAATEKLLDVEDAVEIADLAPVATFQAPKAVAKGISTTRRYKALDVDLKALVIAAGSAAANGDLSLLGYLAADMKAINGVITSLKDKASIPGVRVGVDESISARRIA